MLSGAKHDERLHMIDGHIHPLQRTVARGSTGLLAAAHGCPCSPEPTMAADHEGGVPDHPSYDGRSARPLLPLAALGRPCPTIPPPPKEQSGPYWAWQECTCYVAEESLFLKTQNLRVFFPNRFCNFKWEYKESLL